MQVTTTQSKPKFNPITVSITFESQEEFDLFNKLMSRDMTVPALLYPDNSSAKTDLSNLMLCIYEQL